MCGLTEQEAWLSNPGKLIDLYLWKRDYDAQMHGITFKKGAESDGGPRD